MATKTNSNVVSSNDDDDDDKGVGNLPKLKKKLTREFFSIGFPAFIQLAAEPLAALVDTAYLGGFFRVFLEAYLMMSCTIGMYSDCFYFYISFFVCGYHQVVWVRTFWVEQEWQYQLNML
jgi:Na+-driven multidrug efflux pump